ncbi:MAG: hypothetical protein CBD39_02390 [Flavobacteriaceae bacterium TMED179]|nr:MAG: hypothetical protein CBD39_02390 [Flavobacteriaceae bacterium TMED179]|tara:strand:+ start:107 stop:331 length:225 start_codon:yes stop_codon:yes gene_type:complete
MNNKSSLLIAASIIVSAIIISFSKRYQPSPVNESFVIDSWTGDIYDIQGNNLTEIHKNVSAPELRNPTQTDKIQ